MNITPVYDANYDCYDGIIATICAANNRDFFMIFASKLFFRCISTNSHSVEGCFSLYSYDYATQILEKVHGIAETVILYMNELPSHILVTHSPVPGSV